MEFVYKSLRAIGVALICLGFIVGIHAGIHPSTLDALLMNISPNELSNRGFFISIALFYIVSCGIQGLLITGFAYMLEAVEQMKSDSMQTRNNLYELAKHLMKEEKQTKD
jgi:ABC-type dipeptide/oligopeptide/nickel transport system permease subunit